MPSGCSECPKCHQQTLQPYPSRGRAYCLRVADCDYAEDLAPDKDDQIAVLVEALAPLVGLLKVSWAHSKMPTGCSRSVRKAETLLADLPAAARERAEERERLREALKLAEWGTEGLCGACEHSDQHQHEPGCLVAKALAGEKANR